jgi:hypothetical protein
MLKRSHAGGLSNTANDTCCTEQDETTENDDRPIAPVHPPGEQHEANRGNRDDRDYGRDGAEQSALQPLDGIDDWARSGGVDCSPEKMKCEFSIIIF